MKECGVLIQFNKSIMSKLLKFASAANHLQKSNLIYVNDIYPAFTDLYLIQTKPILLLSYLDYFIQNLPVPVNTLNVIDSLVLSIQYNNVPCFLNRGKVFVSPGNKDIPLSATALPDDLSYLFKYLRESIVRPPDNLAAGEANLLNAGYKAVKSASQIRQAINYIMTAGGGGLRISRAEIQQKYGISARDYTRLQGILKNVLNNDLSNGIRQANIQFSNTGLARIITPSFTLSEQNLRKLERYATRLKKTPDQTLNRLVHDFFTLLDQQKRLDNLRR